MSQKKEDSTGWMRHGTLECSQRCEWCQNCCRPQRRRCLIHQRTPKHRSSSHQQSSWFRQSGLRVQTLAQHWWVHRRLGHCRQRRGRRKGTKTSTLETLGARAEEGRRGPPRQSSASLVKAAQPVARAPTKARHSRSQSRLHRRARHR
ncbi:hypothetical protein CAOG_009303 [Capsaspora owczarzaki ATCC 30864]|uniref:Uncharacterized protein n=1 Tax=Capsaspora owczarzaki (strain ATCC 30864) TaxID=595528 RepID=A0A0D2U0N6_CAPO3|nr:hypothetical protein CAOG_009303 [Capsaspora owczarzaki ATCC 30864]